MKALIMAAALMAASAHAETVAWTPNQDGGLIKFTDTPCASSGYAATIVAADGRILQSGCWKTDIPTFDVLWSDTGDTLYYNAANLTFTAVARRLLEPKP